MESSSYPILRTLLSSNKCCHLHSSRICTPVRRYYKILRTLLFSSFFSSFSLPSLSSTYRTKKSRFYGSKASTSQSNKTEIIQRLEQGDLKLRVRALESERAFQRFTTVQKIIESLSVVFTLHI